MGPAGQGSIQRPNLHGLYPQAAWQRPACASPWQTCQALSSRIPPESAFWMPKPMVSLNQQKLMSRDKDKQQRPALPLSAGDWWARPGGHTQHKTEGRPTADLGTIPHITPHGRRLFQGTRTTQNRPLACRLRGSSRKADDTTGALSVRSSYRSARTELHCWFFPWWKGTGWSQKGFRPCWQSFLVYELKSHC